MSEEPQRIEREVELPADRQAVWDALTQPEILREWLAEEVDLDVREGGAAVFRYAGGEERRGRVEDVVEGERLHLRWRRTGGSESDVEFVLEDAPMGTRLVVVERNANGGPSATAALSEDRLIALELLSLGAFRGAGASAAACA